MHCWHWVVSLNCQILHFEIEMGFLHCWHWTIVINSWIERCCKLFALCALLFKWVLDLLHDFPKGFLFVFLSAWQSRVNVMFAQWILREILVSITDARLDKYSLFGLISLGFHDSSVCNWPTVVSCQAEWWYTCGHACHAGLCCVGFCQS